MKIVDCSALSLVGISTCTKNAHEMDAATAKIMPLWQHFYQDIYPKQLSGNVVYGVYSNYESDANGQFDVIAAVKEHEGDNAQTGSSFDKIELVAGRYIIFSGLAGEGNPVFQLWQQVWQYFEQPDCLHQRSWKTDYEVFHQDGKIELFIGIE
ncbi:GyrI-like domain-containing protein [Xenorhabdus bovienii]|uniref:AraC effector-binding domain-containing protein n=1 Tax=Xenorhabdus bovienii str. oregonense TaxID=1398202 RepID=A0A077P1D0_XENBV|nr:GyrI-like domain-containing protein [Xenorhabdus bovienii]MDE1485711.1 GyrI-like domain-containing protein [Xenorhabdus bovienii]MDE1493459.1 GyrI-like domain-containing protein [Xenorhabdus bovienii]MDE9444535.1 GyrI-like domain-containing protein [Xenorhabdus bovienii]MDE9471555.1 GyrI-like domain-containing protein [Xenorhabdus bovienii]MDE9476445.1 GyrI-like domain-containing protein [Xenorhabdus bovienii]